VGPSGSWWIVVSVLIIGIIVLDEADAAVDQFGEGRVEGCLLDAVAVDVEAVEEGEVEAAAGVVVGADVEAVAVFEEAEGDLESFFDQVVIDAGELDQAFCVALFGGEGVLAFLEVGDGEGADSDRDRQASRQRSFEDLASQDC
jgi:hypothetical protein